MSLKKMVDMPQLVADWFGVTGEYAGACTQYRENPCEDAKQKVDRLRKQVQELEALGAGAATKQWMKENNLKLLEFYPTEGRHMWADPEQLGSHD